MIRWPILAIFWNGYPPSQTTGSTNCCRTTGSPQNNKKHPKRTKPTKAGRVKVYLPDGYFLSLLVPNSMRFNSILFKQSINDLLCRCPITKRVFSICHTSKETRFLEKLLAVMHNFLRIMTHQLYGACFQNLWPFCGITQYQNRFV